jgi:hypothetical protein
LFQKRPAEEGEEEDMELQGPDAKRMVVDWGEQTRFIRGSSPASSDSGSVQIIEG